MMSFWGILRPKNLLQLSDGILHRSHDGRLSIYRDCHGSPIDGETRNDRRKIIIALTPEGKNFLIKVDKIAKQFMKEKLAVFSNEDLEKIEIGLKQLSKLLSKF